MRRDRKKSDSRPPISKILEASMTAHGNARAGAAGSAGSAPAMSSLPADTDIVGSAPVIWPGEYSEQNDRPQDAPRKDLRVNFAGAADDTPQRRVILDQGHPPLPSAWENDFQRFENEGGGTAVGYDREHRIPNAGQALKSEPAGDAKPVDEMQKEERRKMLRRDLW